MKSNLYPKSPLLENYNFISPSPQFRKSVSAVIFSVLLFLMFYIILVVLAGGIMFLSVWAGISLITAKPSFITLAAGAGIIVFGLMLFIFLFKFIFSKNRNDNPLRIEVKESEHPELFAFIRNLNNDTKTKFPKKIFLSPEVNAMVFYNSSFWSLFFPVKKNLEIGLGLVNTLSISELKAALAHEFGHFSQRSMKIGSYIYTVNRVIYNLVYDYDNWDNALHGWAQTGGVFGFFAGITFWLVERVRGLLKIAYNLININYMKLSREMEYHADLMAVSVSGNKSFRDALRKLEFSAFSYNYTTTYLNSLASESKASSDIYSNHSYTTSFLAIQNKMTVKDGFPIITDKNLENSIVKSRVNIKDQWASHPTLKERENNISQVNIEAEVNERSAWEIFTDADSIKKDVTQNLYRVGFPDIEFTDLNQEEYQNFVQHEINKYKISEDYNGFYEGRYLSQLNIEALIALTTTQSFDEVYSMETVESIKRLESNKIDLEILKQIVLKQIPTKYFEFDNKKYKRKEANSLIISLKKEIEEEEVFVINADKNAFIYNYQRALHANKQKELEQLYYNYFNVTGIIKSIDKLNSNFENFTKKLYSQTRWTDDGIKQLAAELSSFEKQFKDFLKVQDIEKLLLNINSEENRELLKSYNSSVNYHSKISFFDEQAFLSISNLINITSQAIGAWYGSSLKKLTDFQLNLYTHREGNLKGDSIPQQL
ncbi:M48 family metalloprotease [Marivirga lumbricoides]